MEAEEKPLVRSQIDIATEEVDDAWHEAFEAHNIWQCSIAVWHKNQNEVTSAAVDAAFDAWMDAKYAAIEADASLDEMIHRQECPECGGGKAPPVEPKVN